LPQLVSHLSPTTRPPTEPTFTLSYTSASYFPLSCPTTIAKGFGFPSWGFGVEGMNSRFTRWLLRLIAEGKRVSACVPMDFYRQDGWAAELLILMNVLNEDGGREKAGEGQPKRP
jgi:1-phosphatidylinositol phosphodiesterase